MQVRLQSLTWAPYLICFQRTLLGHSLHSQQPPCPQHRRFHVGSRRVTAVESLKSRGAPSPARHPGSLAPRSGPHPHSGLLAGAQAGRSVRRLRPGGVGTWRRRAVLRGQSHSPSPGALRRGRAGPPPLPGRAKTAVVPQRGG